MARIRSAGATEATDRLAPPGGARRWSSRFVLVLVVASALLAAGCGDDDDPVVESGALTSTTGMDGDHAAEGDEGEDDHGSFAFGEPAEAADATETVQIAMSDDFAYEPPSVTVAVGDTVLFEVTNDGVVPHEFVLGDHELQLDHEQEMQDMDMGGGMMQDEPNALAVPPGETEQLAFTFTEAGELEYACHQPGHYDAGMIGTLVVE